MIWCSNKITSKINVNPHVKMIRFIWFVGSSYRNCGSSLCHLSFCQWSPWSHIFLQVLGGGSCMMPLLQMPKVLSAIWRQLSGSSMARWITVLLFRPVAPRQRMPWPSSWQGSKQTLQHSDSKRPPRKKSSEMRNMRNTWNTQNT